MSQATLAFHYDVNRHVDEIKNIFMTKNCIVVVDLRRKYNEWRISNETQQKRILISIKRHVEEALKNYIFLSLFFFLR